MSYGAAFDDFALMILILGIGCDVLWRNLCLALVSVVHTDYLPSLPLNFLIPLETTHGYVAMFLV